MRRDINSEAARTLSALPYRVVYNYPESFNRLPIVSFYNLSETDSFCADNAPVFQRGYIECDVWTKKAAEGGRISLDVIAAMEADGWAREFSRDITPDGGVYHRTIRFVKDFYLE